MHVDTTILPLGPGKILINPEYVDPDRLRHIGRTYSRRQIDPDSDFAFAVRRRLLRRAFDRIESTTTSEIFSRWPRAARTRYRKSLRFGVPYSRSGAKAARQECRQLLSMKQAASGPYPPLPSAVSGLTSRSSSTIHPSSASAARGGQHQAMDDFLMRGLDNVRAEFSLTTFRLRLASICSCLPSKNGSQSWGECRQPERLTRKL